MPCPPGWHLATAECYEPGPTEGVHMTPKAERPEHIEPDPRTDGIGDGGENELDPPTDEEIAAGVEHDRARAVAADDSEWAAQ